MKYLSSEPFSIGGGGQQYRANWDRIFGSSGLLRQFCAELLISGLTLEEALDTIWDACPIKMLQQHDDIVMELQSGHPTEEVLPAT